MSLSISSSLPVRVSNEALPLKPNLIAKAAAKDDDDDVLLLSNWLCMRARVALRDALRAYSTALALRDSESLSVDAAVNPRGSMDDDESRAALDPLAATLAG